jgi:pimeloyl-ACP methyl ester carboxylesterase
VHPNAEGHWVIAQPLLTSWGVKQDYSVEDFVGPAGRLHQLYQKVSARQKVLKAAWLSECGHKRPGVEPGLPLAEAEAKAAEITEEINTLLAGGKATLAGAAPEAPVPVAIPVLPMASVGEEAAPAMTEAATPPAPVAPMVAVEPVGSPEVAEQPPASASTAPIASMTGATLAQAEPVPMTEPVPPPVPVPGAGAMLASATVSNPVVKESPALFPGVRGKWQGFDRYDFEVNGPLVTVVAPRQAAKGKPWVWHGEFFGHKPDPDVALLEKGFHIAYMKVNDMLGSPAAVKHWDAMYALLTKTYSFNKKPALVGLSRGGLYCYNWAAANPGKVACIYADAPVCDFKSWPGGKGKGRGDAKNWQLVMQLWGFKDEAEALAYKGNPVDNLAPLAKNKVPLLHVFGDADDVVPWEENTGLVAERYRKLGGSIELIAKAGFGHHPHGLQDSTPIVNFILKHAGG